MNKSEVFYLKKVTVVSLIFFRSFYQKNIIPVKITIILNKSKDANK